MRIIHTRAHTHTHTRSHTLLAFDADSCTLVLKVITLSVPALNLMEGMTPLIKPLALLQRVSY